MPVLSSARGDARCVRHGTALSRGLPGGSGPYALVDVPRPRGLWLAGHVNLQPLPCNATLAPYFWPFLSLLVSRTATMRKCDALLGTRRSRNSPRTLFFRNRRDNKKEGKTKKRHLFPSGVAPGWLGGPTADQDRKVNQKKPGKGKQQKGETFSSTTFFLFQKKRMLFSCHPSLPQQTQRGIAVAIAWGSASCSRSLARRALATEAERKKDAGANKRHTKKKEGGLPRFFCIFLSF